MKPPLARLAPLTLALLLAPLATAQTVLAQSAPNQTAPNQTFTATASGLTLAQALGALTQAPGWRSAALRSLAASQSLDAARARAGLSVSAGADVSAVRVPIDGDWSASTTLNVQAAVNVLPWSAAQAGVVQAARALYRAGLDQRDSQNALALSVVQDYLSARQAAATLDAAGQSLELANRQLEVARAQLQAGVLTQEGLLAAQVSQEQATGAASEARSTLDTALLALYTTLGLTLPDLGQGGLTLTSRAATPAAPAPLDVLLARAARGRSEILKAQSDRQDGQDALAAALLDRRLPNLSLNVQYGQLASTTGTAGTTVSSGLNIKTGVLSAGASLPLNTPQGATTPPTALALGLSGSVAILNPSADAAVQSAQTSLASAELALATSRTSVELDVRQKAAGLQNALQALTAPRTALTRAQTVLSSAQARQQAGLATALDVQQAQLGVVQARNALDTAVDTAYLASLNLSVATAEFSPALIVAAQPTTTQPNAPQSTPSGDQP